MTNHRHHTGARALRLLLGRFRGGPLEELESTNILIDEMNGCDGSCWFVVADQLADMLAREIRARIAEQPNITLEDVVRRLEWRLILDLDRDLFDEYDELLGEDDAA